MYVLVQQVGGEAGPRDGGSRGKVEERKVNGMEFPVLQGKSAAVRRDGGSLVA
ncbi:hypothetical protein HispidOSU_027097, partial [Sigmodon hispidus]